jgi:hypothetical protein
MKRILFIFLLLASFQFSAYAEIDSWQKAYKKCQKFIVDGYLEKGNKCFKNLPALSTGTDIPPATEEVPKNPPEQSTTKTPLQKCRDLAKSDASDDEVKKCFKKLCETPKTPSRGEPEGDANFSTWDKWNEYPSP